MSDFSVHRKAYDQWEQVKSLDANSDGKITHAEVTALDSDQSGKLNDSEFQQAGLSDPTLQAEMRLRYKQAADQALLGSDPDAVLFQVDEIDGLSAPEWDKSNVAQEKGQAAIAWISGGVINALDPNNDQQLTIAEFRTLDPIKLQQMASQRGVDPRIVEDIGNYLDYLVIDGGLSEDDAAFDATQLTNPFEQSWVFLRDQGSTSLGLAQFRDTALKESSLTIDAAEMGFDIKPEALESARQTLERSEKMELIEYQQLTSRMLAVDPQQEVAGLLNDLENLEGVSFETMKSLRLIIQNQGPEAAIQVSTQLRQFLNDPANPMEYDQKCELVNELLHDIACPSDIDQQSKGTCAAAAPQMKLALLNPQKYIELCTTLAQGKPYTLSPATASTPAVMLNPNSTYADDDDDTRSLSCKVMQNAFMDYCLASGTIPNRASYTHQGQTIHFDSRLSVDAAQGLSKEAILQGIAAKHPELQGLSEAQLKSLGDGLYAAEGEALEDHLFGDTEVIASFQQEDPVAAIEAQIASGNPVNINFKGHAVTLEGLDPQNPGRYVVNSWGSQYSLSRADLTALVQSALAQTP